MTINRVKSDRSHFYYGPGRALVGSEIVEAVEHLNYVMGEVSDVLFSMNPQSVCKFDSGDTNILRFAVYINPDLATVRIGIRGQTGYWGDTGASAIVAVTVGGAPAQNFTINTGNHLTVQTSDIAISSTGSGLQTVTVTAGTFGGTPASSERRLGLLSITTKPYQSLLPGVKDE